MIEHDQARRKLGRSSSCSANHLTWLKHFGVTSSCAALYLLLDGRRAEDSAALRRCNLMRKEQSSMSTQLSRPLDRQPSSDSEIRTLYQQLLGAWDKRDAATFAALFAEDGNLVGFDGSQMNGRVEIESQIGQIFADHPTAGYVGKIREVRFVTPEVAILRAVAGMVPPGQ